MFFDLQLSRIHILRQYNLVNFIIVLDVSDVVGERTSYKLYSPQHVICIYHAAINFGMFYTHQTHGISYELRYGRQAKRNHAGRVSVSINRMRAPWDRPLIILILFMAADVVFPHQLKKIHHRMKPK